MSRYASKIVCPGPGQDILVIMRVLKLLKNVLLGEKDANPDI